MDNSARHTKKLQKRINELEKKYNALTDQCELEMMHNTGDEVSLDYLQLMEERNLVKNSIKRLTEEIEQSSRLKKKKLCCKQVSVGNVVKLVNTTKIFKVQVVDKIYYKFKDHISSKSPLGRAILGKQLGEKVFVKTPSGETYYVIREIK
jgi:transcription elongation factor GreA